MVIKNTFPSVVLRTYRSLKTPDRMQLSTCNVTNKNNDTLEPVTLNFTTFEVFSFFCKLQLIISSAAGHLFGFLFRDFSFQFVSHAIRKLSKI